MGDVVDIRFNPNAGNVLGRASCLHCKHEWDFKAPYGVVDLDCPACNLKKGVYKVNFALSEGATRFVCNYCDSDVYYYVSGHGLVCVGCGFSHGTPT